MSYSLSIRIPDSLNACLEQIALNTGVNKSELIRKALQAYLEQRNSEVAGCHELLGRIAYVSLVLQNLPDKETWLWLQKEIVDICHIMTNHSASCDGSITSTQT